MNFKHNKVIRKVRKRWHQNPLFGHIGDEILKIGKKKYIGVQHGMKLSLGTNLVLNWVWLVFSFLESFQHIIDVVMCIIVINVFEPSLVHLILSFTSLSNFYRFLCFFFLFWFTPFSNVWSFLGLRSFDSPQRLLTCKQVSLLITLVGIGFISTSTIALATYLKSWALVVSIIVVRFMVN
jgi:hypothetical protein